MSSACSGFMMAEVRPAPIIIGRNAAPNPRRFGRPKEKFDAPQDRVDLELALQPAQEIHEPRPGVVDRADRHHQRIDDHILALDAEIGGALDDPLGDGEAHIWVLGYAGLVVGDRDHRGAVFLDERQDALEPLLLAGHRIDQRLSLIGGEAGFERLDDRGIDRERNVDRLLHQLDAFGEDPGLVGERNAGIDVEHLRPGLDLGQRLGDDPAVIARRHLGREQLAPGRIDPLADHDEAALKADDDFLGGGGDEGFGHGTPKGTAAGYPSPRPSPASGRGGESLLPLAGARWPARPAG